MPSRRWYHRLRLDGTVVGVAGAVSQQERLDGQEAFAATVRVVGTPSATEGDAVDLALVDAAATTGRWQLVGQLDAIDAVSFPHEQVWTLVDVLATARRARESDRDWTGMTDGAAVQNALTFAGIAYDPADIADAGYVLGAKTDVFWLADRTAAEVIAELDALFQMRTLSLDDGRVVRVRYTLWPTTADAVAAYDRGNSTIEPYLFGAQRARGRFDDVINAVRVAGAGYDCGECRCSVWARAEADHPALGAGVRTRPLVLSSDFIQSTGLAEAIARDAMRRHNRLRDRVRVTTENNPNITVGKVITVRDAAAGIDLASDRAYTVDFVDRLGNRMTLEGVGGAAGAVGTLTSGIERQCNRSTFGDFEAPSFSMPGFGDVPDVPTFGACLACPGGDADCPDGMICGPDGCCLPGGGEDGPHDADAPPPGEPVDVIGQLSPWSDEGCAGATPGTSGGELVLGHQGCGVTADVAPDWNDDWRLSFTVSGAGADAGFSIGIVDSQFYNRGFWFSVFGPAHTDLIDMGTDGASEALDPLPSGFDHTDPFSVVLERVGDAVTWSIDQGGDHWENDPDWGEWGDPPTSGDLGLRIHSDWGEWTFTAMHFAPLG